MTCLGVIGIRLPLSYVCGIVLEGGLVGAWIGMCADILLRAVLAFGRFVQGGWAAVRV
jgi:Na+-driven multidrug efflux pump